MKILVSNDDGYQSPGIQALARALSAIGDVTVVAPAEDRSAASNSLTLSRPLHVRQCTDQAFPVYYVDGTPADCVHVAVNGLLDFRPDIVVSGVNNGPNLGDDTIYSGTVAAAMEGRRRNQPPAAPPAGAAPAALDTWADPPDVLQAVGSTDSGAGSETEDNTPTSIAPEQEKKNA